MDGTRRRTDEARSIAAGRLGRLRSRGRCGAGAGRRCARGERHRGSGCGRLAAARPFRGGFARSRGCDRRRRLPQSGRFRHGFAVGGAGAVLQRQPRAHQRRRDVDPPGKPAWPVLRCHLGAGERQAPPSRRGHQLLGQRRQRRRPRARPFGHPRHRAEAPGGAARRRVGPVRFGCHRRGDELRAEGCRRGRQHRSALGPQLRRRRRRRRGRGEHRAALDGRRVHQLQRRVQAGGPHQPQRATGRCRGPHRRRQHRRAAAGGANLGCAGDPRGLQAVRQPRHRVGQWQRSLRVRQLGGTHGGRRLLLP